MKTKRKKGTTITPPCPRSDPHFQESSALSSALQSASAVHSFTQVVEMVLLEVDQGVGLSGSDTRTVDPETLDAIKAIVRKYNTVGEPVEGGGWDRIE